MVSNFTLTSRFAIIHPTSPSFTSPAPSTPLPTTRTRSLRDTSLLPAQLQAPPSPRRSTKADPQAHPLPTALFLYLEAANLKNISKYILPLCKHIFWFSASAPCLITFTANTLLHLYSTSLAHRLQYNISPEWSGGPLKLLSLQTRIGWKTPELL